MHSLIITTISIALMAACLYFGINYINHDKYDQVVMENIISTDFYNYETSINTYKKTFNIYPDTANWEIELKKTKLLLPNNDSKFYSYEYNRANNTVAVCFKKDFSKNDYQYITKFHEKGLTILASDCYKTVNEVIDTTPDSFTVALTMWIKD